MRIGLWLLAVLGTVGAGFAAQATGAPPAQGDNGMEMATEAGFTAWVAGFRTRAMAAGITPQTFDAAFRDARPGSTMAKPESG